LHGRADQGQGAVRADQEGRDRPRVSVGRKSLGPIGAQGDPAGRQLPVRDLADLVQGAAGLTEKLATAPMAASDTIAYPLGVNSKP
jgi:hypothetical protein